MYYIQCNYSFWWSV